MARTRTRSNRSPALAFDALTVEGALIAPAMLARIAQHQAGGQTEADYAIPKGLTLRDEIARYFRIGQALFRELTASPTPSHAATVSFVEKLLTTVFGFTDIQRVGRRTVGDRQFTLTLEALGGRAPIVVVPPTDDLDRPSDHLATDGRRRSAASALQDWLNAHDGALWGLAANGLNLRLTRDNASLTRPAYIEADLKRVFEGEDFADFTALWLLLHASRFGTAGAPPSDCPLERWREAGQKEGVTAREKLGEGVKAALLSLGNGFLEHPDNGPLREKLDTPGALPLSDFFGQLLRLVYRMIFLLAAEDRNLLHPPSASAAQRKLYAEGYSLGLLRDRAMRRSAWDRHHDRWEGLNVTFRALARGEPRLGLPALDGLFALGTIPDLEAAKLSNRSLMEAIRTLAWLEQDGVLAPVNWRDMKTEELGSVYEGLLELTPQRKDGGRSLAFAEGSEGKGNERKKTGSYYTPDSLVQALLNSALDPVLDRVMAEAGESGAGGRALSVVKGANTPTADARHPTPEQALLSVTVLDPACGSGHFLLAAAHRIASRLANVRSGGNPSPNDHRHALRDVARACIYGVDRNPMAVELTKVALWIETVEPGKPLGFLDANIRCGDSLLGVFDLKALEQGIPDAAYKPLAGDDKAVARYYAQKNRREVDEREKIAKGFGFNQQRDLMRDFARLRQMPEDTPDELAAKAARLKSLTAKDAAGWTLARACDLYVAAFTAPKVVLPQTAGPDGLPRRGAETVPTSGTIWELLRGVQPYGLLVQQAERALSDARPFHWPLEFPDVMAAGGFDVVLGNPPWERIKLQEQEFFAAREPEIAEAPNAAARGRLIAALSKAEPGTRERALFDAFEAAKRTAEAASVFARVPAEDGGRFPLTGRGDVNTYALFAELFLNLTSARGRAGPIVPTGIAFDDTTRYFFNNLVDRRRLLSLFSFFEVRRWFLSTDDRKPFCLLTMGSANAEPTFAFDIRTIDELRLKERCFSLSAGQISRINPNTKTAPVFRSREDADLTTRIYSRVPVLIDEAKGTAGNLWGLSFLAMFHMSNDSGLFRTASQLRDADLIQESNTWVARPTRKKGENDHSIREVFLPLYEAKMLHIFDHRWNTFEGSDERNVTPEEKVMSSFDVTPRYWVPKTEIEQRLTDRSWTNGWLLGWRDIVGSEGRTLIPCLCPRTGVGDKFLLALSTQPARWVAALYGCLASLVCDYAAKQKVGGSSLKYFVFRQFPVLPPAAYTPADLAFIVPRVLELTYTSQSMAPFARDLGFDGAPFPWDEGRRAQLRAELDAWYARAYGLTRDELRYILDPADVKGPTYPSETFRVLKTNELRRHGEYRTARLVLAAWDAMERGEVREISPPIRVAVPTKEPILTPVDSSTLPDGAWARPSDSTDATLAQLAAIIRSLPEPTPISRIRLAALYALEPRYLTRRLSGADRTTWLRLVGPAAQQLKGTNVAAFAPKIDAGWRQAVTQLRGMGAIVEDVVAQTWASGKNIDQFEVDPEGWPYGRASFVLKALETIAVDTAVTQLPDEDQAWVKDHAA